jgi:hypothetical protein
LGTHQDDISIRFGIKRNQAECEGKVMAQNEIKAPLLLWAICVMLVFLGFHQLSSGLDTLLNTIEPGPLTIAKIIIGICLIISGIALSFLTAFGRIMVMIESILGIVLLLAQLDWIRFLFNVDQFSRSSGATLCSVVWGVVVCGGTFAYIMFSPAVAKAFKKQNLAGSSGVKKKKYL